MYTLIALTLLSVGFLAGRLTMRSELEGKFNTPTLRTNADDSLDHERVEVHPPAEIKDLDQEQSNPEEKDKYEKRREIQLKKVLEKDNKPDTPHNKQKDAGKKVLTPIETI
jgi:hypothetical protein